MWYRNCTDVYRLLEWYKEGTWKLGMQVRQLALYKGGNS